MMKIAIMLNSDDDGEDEVDDNEIDYYEYY